MKSNRRNFLKTFGAGAGTLAIIPTLPTLFGAERTSKDFPNRADNDLSQPVDKEPLVVLVKNDGLIGFKGLREYSLRDHGLARSLSAKFREMEGEE